MSNRPASVVKLLLTIVLLVPGLPAGAQTQTPSGDGMSQQLGEAILSELRQIRALLEKQQSAAVVAPAPETAKVSGAGFSIGREDAPLTLVEFTDYQCPFCRQFNTGVYERLKKDYIDTGKLRFISRDLPLEIHSDAMTAAAASRCAGDQNKFWEMREDLDCSRRQARFIGDLQICGEHRP